GVAVEAAGGDPVATFHGKTGSFTVVRSDKTGRDFRGKGRLGYVGEHHLRFAGSGEYFLKAGADSPETFLGTADFDNTVARKADVPLKTWERHVRDWRIGDPTWRGGRGKGVIGALNYLAAKGLNSFSFIPYNAGGDGDNVWPFVERDDKFHFDCSKLDQWGAVFAHAQKLGLYLHFKLQETENDDQRMGHNREVVSIPEALDGGATGTERKLYLRELIARFGHHVALNWNLGEENTQTPEEQRAMAQFIRDVDPYDHHLVIHTYPNEQDRVYPLLLGDQSALTGASLQNRWDVAHALTLKWVARSAQTGKPWVVANDEQGSASSGVPPDPGYAGFSGIAGAGEKTYTLHDIRKRTLWGTLLAGGAGVEYYFGYSLPENDLLCEDFRSREQSWNYCRIALEFFREHGIPFWEMRNADALVGNPQHDNSRYCFAKAGELYLVYLPDGGAAEVDLTAVAGRFSLAWFNPRAGGDLRAAADVDGRAAIRLAAPSTDDWLAVLSRK
ncbi:MAG: putative collagen-binding domain-containing protein, partial [Opitutaceae bacterium]